MFSSRIMTALLGLAASLGVASSSSAAIITVGFSGTLASASNYTSDDPDLPSSDFFKVGQAFSGDFSYDDSVPGFFDDSSGGYLYELLGYNVAIGGIDFSSRFLPNNIYRSADGMVSFLTGGASQAGSSAIELSLGSSPAAYPTLAELNGAFAAFNYRDFTPGGGEVTGNAVLNAVVPAVPETDAWVMLIMGFAAIGSALRTRRRFTIASVPQMS